MATTPTTPTGSQANVQDTQPLPATLASLKPEVRLPYPDDVIALIERLGPPEAVLRHAEGEIILYARDLPRPPYAVILGMTGERGQAFLKGLEQWWLINKEMRLVTRLHGNHKFEPLLHAHFEIPSELP